MIIELLPKRPDHFMIVRPASLEGTTFHGWTRASNIQVAGTTLSTNAPEATLKPVGKRWLVDISTSKVVWFHEEFDSARDAVTAIEECFFGNRVADYLGVSLEAYKSFLWPHEIWGMVDYQRRALPQSDTKRMLRAALLDAPRRYDDRWWIAFDLVPPIVFDPQLNEYGIVGEDGVVGVVGNIAAVVSAIERGR